MNNRHKFLNIIRYFFDLINSSVDGYYFLLISVHLLDLLFNINLRNLFELSLSLNHYPLFNLWNNLRLTFNVILLDYLFNDLSNWLDMYSLCINIHWHCFFKINWHRAFNWLIDHFFNKFYLFLLVRHGYNFIYMDVHWNLLPLDHNPLFINLLYLNISSCFNISDHNLIRKHLHGTINCDIDNLLHLDLYCLLDIHILWNIMNFWRHMNRHLNYFLNNLLNNLRHLHYLFYYPWHYHNLLHYLLYLHDLRHFHNLLYDFLFNSRNFFDLFKINLLIHNSLLFH